MSAADDAPAERGVTIDGEHTRDMDDALWVERVPEGWRVTVCVADVARAVAPGSPEDVLARAMGATHYFAAGTSPMLPRDLGEESLSLWPDGPRPALVLDATLSPDLSRARLDVRRGRVQSAVKLWYADVPRYVAHGGPEGDRPGPVGAMLRAARDLAFALCARRREAGAMALYDLNHGWVTTEEGALRTFADVRETVGHLIVQELMVLSNRLLAEWAVARDLPVLFRNHEAAATPTDRDDLARELAEAHLLDPARLEGLRRRTHLLVGRARYGATPRGHYGLALPAYLHGTSPIRRYADLVTHRQVLAAIAGEPLPYSREELDALAEHLHELDEGRRLAEGAAYRGRDEALARRNVEARRLDGLNAASFERAVKVVVEAGGDPTPAFVEGFVPRVAGGRAPLLALTVVAVRAPRTEAWAPVLDACLAALAARPADAPSLLHQARQLDPAVPVPEPELVTTAEGPPHARRFAATATMLGARGEGAGRLAREAEQWACVNLIAAWVGRPAPSRPAAAAPGGAPKAPAAPVRSKELPPPDPGAGDPRVALSEWCQKTGRPVPSYAETSGGPSHQPTITSTCRLGDLVAEGCGPTKAKARCEAAARVIAALPGRAGGGAS